MSGFTSVHIINGQLTIIAGPVDKIDRLRVKIPYRLASSPDHGVPAALLSSIANEFPSALRLELQFDFDGDDTTTDVLAKTVELGGWIGKMVKRALGLWFPFPSDVYIAVTDKTFLYSSDEEKTALGEDGEEDSPAVVIMGNKGYLVHVGTSMH